MLKVLYAQAILPPGWGGTKCVADISEGGLSAPQKQTSGRFLGLFTCVCVCVCVGVCVCVCAAAGVWHNLLLFKNVFFHSLWTTYEAGTRNPTPASQHPHKLTHTQTPSRLRTPKANLTKFSHTHTHTNLTVINTAAKFDLKHLGKMFPILLQNTVTKGTMSIWRTGKKVIFSKINFNLLFLNAIQAMFKYRLCSMFASSKS